MAIRAAAPDLDCPRESCNLPEMGNLAGTRSSRPARRKAAAERADTATRLADALFTTTQQRVLALLFGQPARSFFASALIELTGSGSGAVQRELKRLASSCLVTVTRIGQLKTEATAEGEVQGLIRSGIGRLDDTARGELDLESRLKSAAWGMAEREGFEPP